MFDLKEICIRYFFIYFIIYRHAMKAIAKENQINWQCIFKSTHVNMSGGRVGSNISDFELKMYSATSTKHFSMVVIVC